jgi:hypothetical protein
MFRISPLSSVASAAPASGSHCSHRRSGKQRRTRLRWGWGLGEINGGAVFNLLDYLRGMQVCLTTCSLCQHGSVQWMRGPRVALPSSESPCRPSPTRARATRCGRSGLGGVPRQSPMEFGKPPRRPAGRRRAGQFARPPGQRLKEGAL